MKQVVSIGFVAAPGATPATMHSSGTFVARWTGMIVEPTMLVLALGLSLVVGVSLGLLGGGGSILTMPILLYVLGMETHRSIVTSLVVVGATSAAALVAHARGGRVRWRTGLLFGVSSTTAAFVAGRFSHHVPGMVLLVGFGALMLIAGLAMMRARREPQVDGAGSKRRSISRIVVQASGVGSITGLVGAGGGFMVVPALGLLGGLSMGEAVGTSLLVIAMNSAAALVGYFGTVSIDLGLAGAITGAAILGSILGGSLAGRVRQELLRRAFAWFLLAMAAFLLFQELPRAAGFEVELRADWPWVLGGASVPLVAGVLDLRRLAARSPRAEASGPAAG